MSCKELLFSWPNKGHSWQVGPFLWRPVSSKRHGWDGLGIKKREVCAGTELCIAHCLAHAMPIRAQESDFQPDSVFLAHKAALREEMPRAMHDGNIPDCSLRGPRKKGRGEEKGREVGKEEMERRGRREEGEKRKEERQERRGGRRKEMGRRGGRKEREKRKRDSIPYSILYSIPCHEHDYYYGCRVSQMTNDRQMWMFNNIKILLLDVSCSRSSCLLQLTDGDFVNADDVEVVPQMFWDFAHHSWDCLCFLLPETFYFSWQVAVVIRQLPAELVPDSDDEEVGEELGPVVESGEGSDGCSVSEAETEPGLSDISQLRSERDISGEEEQLEPVPDARTGAESGRKGTHVDAEWALPGE
ncbi:Nop9, partial [Ophiophagus hannah]